MKKLKLHPSSETKFPDISDLKFFRSEADLYYFNAGDFLQKSEPGVRPCIADFFRSFHFLIEALRNRNGLEEGDLYVSDPSGKEYLEECLVLPFLAYVDMSFGVYMIERTEDLLRFGFSINDTMAKYFYQTRLDQQSL